jgi:hypothetical protein
MLLLQISLFDDFGSIANTEAADQVLAGTYEAQSNIDPFAKLLLNEMRLPAHVTPLTTEDLKWTPEDLERHGKSNNSTPAQNPQDCLLHT